MDNLVKMNDKKIWGERIILMQKDVPNCDYLKIVLCLWKGQYVTWTLNTDFGGCNGGHYFDTDLTSAVKDFNERS